VRCWCKHWCCCPFSFLRLASGGWITGPVYLFPRWFFCFLFFLNAPRLSHITRGLLAPHKNRQGHPQFLQQNGTRSESDLRPSHEQILIPRARPPSQPPRTLPMTRTRRAPPPLIQPPALQITPPPPILAIRATAAASPPSQTCRSVISLSVREVSPVLRRLSPFCTRGPSAKDHASKTCAPQKGESPPGSAEGCTRVRHARYTL